MTYRSLILKSLLVSLGLTSSAVAWWGCAAAPSGSAGGSAGDTTTSTAGTGGAGGTGGSGMLDGGGGEGGEEVCTSISAEATRVQLDIVFLVDRSQSMSGTKWIGTTAALTNFFNDPKSINIGAGMVFFPNDNEEPCVPLDYAALDVPIDVLPDNAFALTNAFPFDATGGSTPTYGALKGALIAATARQDTHPERKVIVVLATDGGPNSCGPTTIDDIANLAKSARNYNGVLTYVVGVDGADIAAIDKIAVGGGTVKTYDVTTDISEFAGAIEDIRGKALGCEFQLPPPPNGQELDPNRVNFTYTPQGIGSPKLLLRADDLLDCGADPGWYYDNNFTPKKIVLCPASCATLQADANAEVEVLFGCKSQIN